MEDGEGEGGTHKAYLSREITVAGKGGIIFLSILSINDGYIVMLK